MSGIAQSPLLKRAPGLAGAILTWAGAIACPVVLFFSVANIGLMAFNLIPIPPLDGSALVERLLPASALPQYYRMRFGFIVIVLLLVFFDQNALRDVFNHFETWYLDIFAR